MSDPGRREWAFYLDSIFKGHVTDYHGFAIGFFQKHIRSWNGK